MAGCPICEDLQHGASGCPHSLIGATLGKYEVTRFLAAGGMGVVYIGQHQSLGSPVAIKTLHRAFLPQNAKTDDRRRLAETLVKRFTDEARRAASLRHPNIVRVEDLGVAPDGTPYLAMEFLEGMSLKELHDNQGVMAPERAAELVAQALDALEFAHQRNIIHRDIKPENLYLQHPGQRSETVKVLDFGIAKAIGDGATKFGLTQTGHGAMGTFYYMSPEQAKDPRQVTASSDVFSVGASLFELLTGRHVLFEVEQELTDSGLMAVQFLHGVLSAIIDGKISRHPRQFRPEVPEWLDALVARSLHTDPAARFASAGEMAAALHAGAAGEPVPVEAAVAAPAAVALASTMPSNQIPAVEAPASFPKTHAAPAPEPRSAPVLGSTTSQSSGERVVPVSQPRSPAPERSRRGPLLAVGGVLVAAIGVTIAVVASGGSETATGDVPDASVAVDAQVALDGAAAPSVDDVKRLALADDCDAAASTYDRLPELEDPTAASLHGAIGSCLTRAKEHGEAEKRFDRALGADPNQPDALFGKATILTNRGERKQALALLERYLKSHPAGSDVEEVKEAVANLKDELLEASTPEKKETGTLAVSSKPFVEVLVNGRRKGDSPLVVTMPVGKHKVTLVIRKHNIRRNYSVVIKAGKKTRLVKDLTPLLVPNTGPIKDPNVLVAQSKTAAKSAQFGKALRLCSEALSIQRGHQEAAMVCGIAACNLKNAAKARRFIGILRSSGRKAMIRQICLRNGVRLDPAPLP